MMISNYPFDSAPHFCGEGVHRTYKFDNGYQASVIRTPYSYGGPAGLWELAVKVDGAITYDTPITGDVLGWLDYDALEATLQQIAELPDRDGVPAMERPFYVI